MRDPNRTRLRRAIRRKDDGLEPLRDIFDRGGIGPVLIGMPGLERRLSRYALLDSRVGFEHEFRSLVAAEVKVVLAGWRPAGISLPADLLADVDGVAALIRATGGNFRLLDRLLAQLARIQAINGQGVMTPAVVQAACEGLVIGAV